MEGKIVKQCNGNLPNNTREMPNNAGRMADMMKGKIAK